MHDVNLVHCVESPDRLDNDFPNLPLLDISSVLLVTQDLLEHVTVLTELHYDAKAL